MFTGQHDTVREGATAGFLGAIAIALWFLVIDVTLGRPFYTPGLLGGALLSVLGPTSRPDSMMIQVVAYTIFHFAVFMAVGILAAYLVHRAEESPSILAGFLILFVAFEVGWYGLTALLSQDEAWGRLAWWQVLGANLVAALLMGTYLWRRHPQLRESLAYSLGGAER